MKKNKDIKIPDDIKEQVKKVASEAFKKAGIASKEGAFDEKKFNKAVSIAHKLLPVPVRLIVRKERFKNIMIEVRDRLFLSDNNNLADSDIKPVTSSERVLDREEPTLTCSKCNQENAADAKFCSECGRGLLIQDSNNNEVSTEIDGAHKTLMEAAIDGDLDTIETLIEKGGDVNEADEHGTTIIMIAADYNDKNIVKYLIDNGANINIQDNVTGETPLFFAAKSGRSEITKLLLDNGADVYKSDFDGETALLYAMRNGNFETTQIIKTVILRDNKSQLNDQLQNIEDPFECFLELSPDKTNEENIEYKISLLNKALERGVQADLCIKACASFGSELLGLGKYDEAVGYYEYSLRLAEENKFSLDLPNDKLMYRNLCKYYVDRAKAISKEEGRIGINRSLIYLESKAILLKGLCSPLFYLEKGNLYKLYNERETEDYEEMISNYNKAIKCEVLHDYDKEVIETAKNSLMILEREMAESNISLQASEDHQPIKKLQYSKSGRKESAHEGPEKYTKIFDNEFIKTAFSWFRVSDRRLRVVVYIGWGYLVFMLTMWQNAKGASAVYNAIPAGVIMGLYVYSVGAAVSGPLRKIFNAIHEGESGWIVGLITFPFITLPWYIIGWPSEKLFNLFFYKFTCLGMGIAYFKKREYNKAIFELEKAKVSKKDIDGQVMLHASLGDAYEAVERYDDAIEQFSEAIHHDPGDNGLKLDLAYCYMMINQYNDALALCREILSNDPQNINAHWSIARCYINMDMYDEAMDYIKQGIALEPQTATGHKMMAEIHFGLGDEERAVKEAQLALSYNPVEIIANEAQEIIDIIEGNIDNKSIPSIDDSKIEETRINNENKEVEDISSTADIINQKDAFYDHPQRKNNRIVHVSIGIIILIVAVIIFRLIFSGSTSETEIARDKSQPLELLNTEGHGITALSPEDEKLLNKSKKDIRAREDIAQMPRDLSQSKKSQDKEIIKSKIIHSLENSAKQKPPKIETKSFAPASRDDL